MFFFFKSAKLLAGTNLILIGVVVGDSQALKGKRSPHLNTFVMD